LVRRWLDDFAAGTLVLGLCCFPAAPVLQVAYTESMALLVVVLALRALEQRHYGQLVLWAAVLAVTRPVLLPLGLLAGLVWLTRWRRRHHEDFPLGERWRFAAAIACCGALVGAWPLVAGIVTGERSAFTDTMASWPTNKEFGGATVNWLTLTAQEPLAWGLVVLPVLALVLWAAFRRPSRPIPGAVRWWGPVYMLYILAATKPSAGLLRYLLVAIFPTMPFLEPEAAARTRADKVVRLVLVGGLAVAGLVGQYYRVMRIFTIQQAPDAEGRLEVVPGVGAEGDVRLGLGHALDLVELVGDHGRDVLVLAHPHQGDQVDLPGDGVDLADAVERGDRLGDLGDARDVGLHEDDGGDHGLTVAPLPRTKEQ
jgi:hypothetical protein